MSTDIYSSGIGTRTKRGPPDISTLPRVFVLFVNVVRILNRFLAHFFGSFCRKHSTELLVELQSEKQGVLVRRGYRQSYKTSAQPTNLLGYFQAILALDADDGLFHAPVGVDFELDSLFPTGLARHRPPGPPANWYTRQAEYPI